MACAPLTPIPPRALSDRDTTSIPRLSRPPLENDALAYLRRCTFERGLAKTTIIGIELSLRMLSRFAPAIALANLRATTIGDFFTDGQERRKWGANRYRNQWKYLKGFYSWCVATGRRPDNPILEIARPAVPRSLPRRLSSEEVDRLMATAATLPWTTPLQHLRNLAILATYLYSGLRARELLDLRTNDVNLGTGAIFVRNGKGGKDRPVPIHANLVPMITAYWHERQTNGAQSSFAFSSLRSPSALTYKNLRSLLKHYEVRSGVRFTVHQLRHTFASEALERGYDLFMLKEVLGHSSISTTQIYLHVAPEVLKTKLDEINFY